MDEMAALLRRTQEGDFEAFEVIYAIYSAMVHAIALRIAKDRMIAEDVTQDVFVKLWLHLSSFRGDHFSGWLAQVTRNRTISLLRSRPSISENEIPTTLVVESAAEDVAFGRLDAEQVRKALSELREEERTLIELSFFVGVTHEGIAATTGIPLGTIKWRIRSGLRKMREYLGDYMMA